MAREFSRLGVAGLLLSRSGSADAIEPVTTGLAVASTVAGLIAAHNQGDGGLAGTLKATLEYQRALSKQLLAVQEGLALVVKKIDLMEARFQEMLHQQRVKTLQSEIGTQILRYDHEVTTRAGTFRSFSAWLKDDETQRALQDIGNRLESSASQVQQERWFDALTALYVCAAAFTALGVRSARGEQNAQLKAEAQRYLNIFELFENKTEAGTVAHSNANVRSVIALKEKEVREKMGIASMPGAGSQVFVPLGVLAVFDSTPFPPMTDECVPKNKECRIPFHQGFEMRAPLTSAFQLEKNSKGGSIEILQYSLGPAQAVPTAGNARKIRPLTSVRSELAADHLKAAVDSDYFKAAQAKADQYKPAVDQLNLELARAALDGSALVAISATRQRLFRHFGKGA